MCIEYSFDQKKKKNLIHLPISKAYFQLHKLQVDSFFSLSLNQFLLGPRFHACGRESLKQKVRLHNRAPPYGLGGQLAPYPPIYPCNVARVSPRTYSVTHLRVGRSRAFARAPKERPT